MPPRRRRRAQPVAAADIVKRFRRSTGRGAPTEGDGPLPDIQDRWEEVAGAAVAAKARPVRRSQAGVVTVACADGVWAQTLSSQADQLLERLQAATPPDALTALRFVPDEHALRRAAETSPTPPSGPPPTPEQLAAAEGLVEGVTDPALKSLLARAAARAPSRKNRPKSP